MKTEEQIQAQCFRWLWNEFPITRRLLFHIPNGGQRNIKEASKFKAIGLVPGIPDMAFVWKGQTHYLEFKTKVGKLSTNQVKVHSAFNKQGIKVHMVRSFEDFKEIVNIIMTSQNTPNN